MRNLAGIIFYSVVHISLISGIEISDVINMHEEKQYSNIEDIVVQKFNYDVGVKIVNPCFRNFIISVVENALEEGRVHTFSNGLLKCYEQSCKNDCVFAAEDLKEAWEDLMPELVKMQEKAPRPGEVHPIVGPLDCDLADVNALLNSIYNLLFVCCQESSIAFNGTFTALYDIKGTLTACCANIINDFNATFSVLLEGSTNTYTTFRTGFDITFTLAQAINLEITIVTDVLGGSCNNLATSLGNCCTTIINDLATLGPLISPLANLATRAFNYECSSYCILAIAYPTTGCPTLSFCF